jgi:hypothetical protein
MVCKAASGTFSGVRHFPEMPRFYFNVLGTARQSVDDLGKELPDENAAWKEATIIAGELFRDIDGNFQPGQEWSLEVTDSDRRSLYFISITARKMK